MLVVTYSEARQNFASILDKSKNDGAVLVKRADGSVFRISPEVSESSPFAGIKTLFDIRHDDIMQSLKETREEN
ncbi:MAG: type II toxin-antitoxin system Phd/YefM family antitoxin [Treponema sp.]|nr:type II toxin-antitoxin system Phd/YefM family antitoxin [Treponema sp.]MCI6891925.1 type II toxin-antitoxin system Phd/YefM family antitoxin [Treponema sp.]MCI7566695.1 type II toxin-antitoxin system Phd/YefM family antitoxin [Treponema sp.]